jgi:hypothetical protein
MFAWKANGHYGGLVVDLWFAKSIEVWDRDVCMASRLEKGCATMCVWINGWCELGDSIKSDESNDTRCSISMGKKT